MKKPAKKLPATKVTGKPAATVKKATNAKKAAAPAKKKTAASDEPPVTFISAQIDIGFGNHLTIRGSGPGLSWDEGLVMENAGANLWTVALRKVASPVTFKLLVNDLSWSAGADYVTAPGKSITVFPTF